MPVAARFLTFLYASVLVLLTCVNGLAQTNSRQAKEKEQAAVFKVGVTVSPGGMQRHVPQRWTILNVNGINRSDADTEELVVVQFGDDANKQYARRFWIPANSRRQTWVPAMLPAFNSVAQPQLEMKTIRLKDSDSGEQFQTNVLGEPISQRSLLVSSEHTRAAVLFDQAERTLSGSLEISKLIDATLACRDTANGSVQDLGIVRHTSVFLPTSPKTFDAIDHLVIGGDRLIDDVQSTEQIRQWVQSGGRLWLMADRLSADTAKLILQDAGDFTEIDRIDIMDFQLKLSENSSAHSIQSSQWSSDYPVQMVRVATSDADVQSSVNGWPAAFWYQYGKGEILITTVDLHGLMVDGRPIDTFRATIGRFFVPRVRPQRHTAQLTRLMDQEIGYSVPSRGLIAWVLGAHLLIVLLAGVWFTTRKQLHYMAFVLPLAAGAAAVFLMFLGQQNTQAVESTAALGQFVRVSRDGNSAQIDATAAVFSQDDITLQVVGTSGTSMRISDGETDGQLNRVLWTDDGKSQWMHLKQPPGVVRHINSQATIALKNQVIAEGQFTADGFQGHVQGIAASDCQDLVVLSDSAPTLALKPSTRDDETVFVGGQDDILLNGQYISETLMSDQQRQRQDMLRDIKDPGAALFGRQPSMLFWAKPLEAGLQIDDRFEKRGSALMSVPIKFTPPQKGSHFSVPSSFVRMDLRKGDNGFSSLYNPQTGRWLNELTKASSAQLSCYVPPTLLPCKLASATVQIKLNAPSRTLELKTFVNGEYETVFQRENPTGLISVTIDEPRSLSVTPQGAVGLLVSVSATEEELAAEKKRVINPRQATQEQLRQSRNNDSNKDVWGIDYLHVSFKGITQ